MMSEEAASLIASSAEEIVLTGRFNPTTRHLELVDPPVDLTPGTYRVKIEQRPALSFGTHRQAVIDASSRGAKLAKDSLGRFWSVPRERYLEPGPWNDYNPQKGK